MEEESAMRALSVRLNKVSNVSNDFPLSSAQPDSCESFTDSGFKRKGSDCSPFSSKRSRGLSMGRSSKGNTGNESRNLYKWLKDASDQRASLSLKEKIILHVFLLNVPLDLFL